MKNIQKNTWPPALLVLFVFNMPCFKLSSSDIHKDKK